MAELVRVAALTGYFRTMEALGADPEPMLRDAGLSQKSLSRPEQMVPALAAMRLLDRSAEATGCRTFGLRMAPTRGLADFGVTSLLIEHEANVRAALTALVRYRDLINRTLLLDFEEMGDAVLIRQTFTLGEVAASQQAIDLALGAVVRLAFMVGGEGWQPELVCFTCAPPPAADLPIYRRVFQCPVEFDATCDGIVITTRDLERPCLRADPALAEHARKLIEAAMGSERRGLSQQVERAISLLMPSGHATIQGCADLLGVTVRTLQRTLDAEDTSFSDLLHAARMQMANQHMRNPRTRITDVAGLLGYRSIAAFTRWHQQAYGMTPSERRRHAAAEDET